MTDHPAPASRARAVRDRVVVALVLIAALAVLGVLAGLLWHAIAPRTPYVFTDHAGSYVRPVPSRPIAADGWFAVIALVAGIGCGSVAQGLFHDRLTAAAVGLAIGGVAASLIAWQVGHWFGAEAYEQAVRTVHDGERLYAPLDVKALGVLTLWPLAATLTVFLGALMEELQQWSGRRRTRRRELAEEHERGAAELDSRTQTAE
ncbi:MAG: hypothetical protein ACRDMV_13600 [Streptosporangiales bacterium]